MDEHQNIELQIPLTAATEATSETQNQSCTVRRKYAVSFIVSVVIVGIVLAIALPVMLLIPQDPAPDHYEEYYDYESYDETQNIDYNDITPQIGGDTTAAKIEDVS